MQVFCRTAAELQHSETPMPPKYDNAIVTGACGGLGQALAAELIAAGARVALVGLRVPVLQGLAASAPDRCGVYTPDVTDSSAMQAAACFRRWHGSPASRPSLPPTCARSPTSAACSA
jgi:hypothetical protein